MSAFKYPSIYPHEYLTYPSSYVHVYKSESIFFCKDFHVISLVQNALNSNISV